MPKTITLDHGSGGLLSQQLISNLFLSHLTDKRLMELEDSAVLDLRQDKLAFTTDSYVVDPIFFPGGDIGELAVNGTINDLAMRGAEPIGLSLGLILEEGLELSTLEKIIASIAKASKEASVPVVTGDTKVVPHGKADKIFINTSGIGLIKNGQSFASHLIKEGDAVLISGTMGEHGVTILTSRANMPIQSNIQSDTQPLHRLVQTLIANLPLGALHAMRDPTRGGLATVLCEVSQKAGVQIDIQEGAIPIIPEALAACDILGFDPLYLANEGKCVVFVEAKHAEKALKIMHSCQEAKEAAIIGKVLGNEAGTVVLHTKTGGKRLLMPLSGEPLPRIC